MGSASGVVIGERSPTKVVGFYRNGEAAKSARTRLLGAGWRDEQVVVLGPDDGRVARRAVLARKLEPEPHGIWRTIVRAHLVTGAVGLVIGVAIWGALLGSGQRLVASSPTLAFVAIVFLTTTLALLVGGLIALRPDHARVITSVRSALRGGGWAVVVHALDGGQAERAEADLRAGSERVERTL